jgi:hypothetical protein
VAGSYDRHSLSHTVATEREEWDVGQRTLESETVISGPIEVLRYRVSVTYSCAFVTR